MVILNLGCGTRTCAHRDVVNIDRSPYLRIRSTPLLRLAAPLLIRGERWRKYQALPRNILVRDLSRGIPAVDGSADAVYHSHFLEHLEPDRVPAFLAQVLRVLRPGGIHRVVVPDLAYYCRRYLDDLDACGTSDKAAAAQHERFVADLIEPLVRIESFSATRQGPMRRALENLLLGGARRRGDRHAWMYDRVSLRGLLESAGFTEVAQMTHETSAIAGWNGYGLDRDANGGPYKPDSIYLEARKPG